MIQLHDLRWLQRPVRQSGGDLFMSSTFHLADGTKFPGHGGYLLISVHRTGENKGERGYRIDRIYQGIYQEHLGFSQVEAAA